MPSTFESPISFSQLRSFSLILPSRESYRGFLNFTKVLLSLSSISIELRHQYTQSESNNVEFNPLIDPSRMAQITTFTLQVVNPSQSSNMSQLISLLTFIPLHNKLSKITLQMRFDNRRSLSQHIILKYEWYKKLDECLNERRFERLRVIELRICGPHRPQYEVQPEYASCEEIIQSFEDVLVKTAASGLLQVQVFEEGGYVDLCRKSPSL
ncbi:hypothetical protein AX16_001865 [Volvariella volvacea WC 439]|nr:hypothetical protein AX16_001865 [Volvariella volvacea WC 439]